MGTRSATAAARYLELPANLVRSAVRYYAAYPQEIDELIDRQEAAAEREMAAAERERAAFG